MDSGKSEEQTRPPVPEGSCHFFIERKKRYCRFKPAKDSSFCAEHATTFQNDGGRKRMTCPYDSKHTCYVDKLTHHMNRCPSRPKEMPAYYSKGINSGDNDGEVVPDPKVTVLTVTGEELQCMINKVNKLYDQFIREIPVNILSHPCLREELKNSTYGTAALRHRKQMASIIGLIERLDLLKDGLCYVEMGAGKGQLTHWLHKAVENKDNNCFVLIDRSHVRNKMDNLHKEEDIMKRYRMDIEDLKLGSVPAIESEERPVVAYGKHLCGPATDLALRCATETLLYVADRADGPEEEPQRKKHKSGERTLAGCVIALCCHHRCTWSAYVGKKFFRLCGLSARDFQLLSSLSSWATCTWKGWSHTKKTEDDQLTTGSDIIDLKDQGSKPAHECGVQTSADKSDSISHKNISDECNNHKNNKKGSEDHESDVLSAENATILSTQTEKGVKKENEKLEEIVNTEAADHMNPCECHAQEDTTPVYTNECVKYQLKEKEREVIGRKCKQLIDFGRVKYLEDHGLTSTLNIYIEDFYTPENVVLLAKLK